MPETPDKNLQDASMSMDFLEIAGSIITEEQNRPAAEKPKEVIADNSLQNQQGPDDQGKEGQEEIIEQEVVLGKTVAELEAERTAVLQAEAQKEKKETEKKGEKSFEETFLDIQLDTDSNESDGGPIGDGSKSSKNPEVVNPYANIAERNPLAAAVLGAIETNGDVLEIINQYKVVDVSKMDSRDLINWECTKNGITDPDEINLEIAAYDGLTSPLAKTKHLNAIRSQVISDQNEKNKVLLTKSIQSQEEKKQELRFYKESAKNISKSLVGKTINGVQVTEPMAKEVEKGMIEFNVLTPEGTINVQEIAQLVFCRNLVRTIAKTNRRNGEEEGKAQIMELVSRPDRNQNVSNVKVEQKKQPTQEELTEQAADMMMNGK